MFLVASNICSCRTAPLKYVQSQVAPVGNDFAPINCPLLIFASMSGMVQRDLSPISIIVVLSVEVQKLVRISLAFEVALIKPIPKLVVFATEDFHAARKLNLQEIYSQGKTGIHYRFCQKFYIKCKMLFIYLHLSPQTTVSTKFVSGFWITKYSISFESHMIKIRRLLYCNNKI